MNSSRGKKEENNKNLIINKVNKTLIMHVWNCPSGYLFYSTILSVSKMQLTLHLIPLKYIKCLHQIIYQENIIYLGFPIKNDIRYNELKFQ